VPIAASGLKSHKLVQGSTLHIVKGGAHGMCTVQPDEINEILLGFIKG